MKEKLLYFFFAMLFTIGTSYAQERSVTGKVTSTETGKGLADVTVLVQGSRTAVKTDSDGNFTIKTDKNNLIFRSVGFDEKVISLGQSNQVSVNLETTNSELEEVVVVGYGTGRKASNVVGTVSRVSAKEIGGRPRANALESLQGKVPGLQIFTSSGEPSATQSIRLNGAGSLGASSTPLFVLDGIPVESGSIVSMNPEDFESITVLKDASATSIYGSRAANGVIYMTSKKGKIGDRATVSLRSQIGWSKLATSKMQDNLMNTKELQNFWLETGYRTQAQLDAINATYPNDYKWKGFYFKENTPYQQHDLNISGGSQKTQYYLSTSYLDEEGVMYRSGFDRITLRSNITSKINDWMRVGLNLSGGYDRRQTNQYTSNSLNGGLSLLALPWYTPIDADGNEYYDKQIPGLGRYSPRYLADKLPSMGKNQQFNPNFFVELQPFEGLTIKSQGGMDFYNYRTSARRLPSYLPNIGNGTATEEFDQAYTRTLTNTIEYKFNVNNIHNFILLGGQESVDFRQEGFSSYGVGLTDDRLTLLSNTTSGYTVGQTSSEYSFNSLFGRLSYSLHDKYSVDLTIRQDASSRFGKDLNNSTFWSIGGMWNAKKESFLADVSQVNELRVRASYGTTGNASIGNYAHLATVAGSQYNGQTGWGLNSPGNPQLGWEAQNLLTIGVAGTFFKGLNIDVDYFNRNTKNMLVDVPFAYTSGFSTVKTNVGVLNNKGINLQLSYNLVRNNDFYFTPSITLGYVKQEITELFQGKDFWIVPNTGVSWAVGKPVSYFYPIQKGVNPETGLVEWYKPGDDITVTNKDPNNVTTSFSSAALQQSTGINRYAPLNGGFGFNTGWKGLYLESYFTFSSGKYLINNDSYFFENAFGFAGYNQSKGILDYWKEPGDVTRYPKYGQPKQFDSALIENASFIRLKNITVGYEIPKSILKRSKFFTGAKIYYTGRNLLTFTKYSGPDPEIDANLTTGANPNTKQSVIGIQLLF
ncbi:SusC/RagA family TonB-linked outer membrane protein [Rhinopithecimicrobium faecis]